MAAPTDRPVPVTPHPYHPDYIWSVDHNQGFDVRYPFGDRILNGLEVAPASDKEVAIEHEKELTASTEGPRSSTGADRRGPYLGLTRRFFLILLVMLLVIAGIIVPVVQLVSGNEDSSPQQDMNPITDLGRYYALSNAGVDPSTSLSLTADLIPTSARATHLRLKKKNGTFYQHFSFERVNDTGGRGEIFRFGGAVGEEDPKTSYYYISNRGLINETELDYLLSANMTVNERRTMAVETVELQWYAIQATVGLVDMQWWCFSECRISEALPGGQDFFYECKLRNANLGDQWSLTAGTMDDVTTLDGRWELGAMLAKDTGDGDAAQVWAVSGVPYDMLRSNELPVR